eukprot:313354-Pyramimonas_sp.AAC.1
MDDGMPDEVWGSKGRKTQICTDRLCYPAEVHKACVSEAIGAAGRGREVIHDLHLGVRDHALQYELGYPSALLHYIVARAAVDQEDLDLAA